MPGKVSRLKRDCPVLGYIVHLRQKTRTRQDQYACQHQPFTIHIASFEATTNMRGFCALGFAVIYKEVLYFFYYNILRAGSAIPISWLIDRS